MSAMSRSIWFICDEYVGVKCIWDQDAWLVASLLKSVCGWRNYRMLRTRPTCLEVVLSIFWRNFLGSSARWCQWIEGITVPS